MQCCRTRCFNTSSSRYGPSYASRMDLVWIRKSVVVGVRPSCPREFVSRLYHQSVTALFCFLSSHHGRRIQVPMFLKNCSHFLYTNVCQSRERGVCSSPSSSNCGHCSICISFLSENLLKKPLFFPVEEEACLTLEEAALRTQNRYVLLSL